MTWRASFPLASGLLALFASSCQSAPPMTMVACEINSDCPVPLVCMDGMCQAECLSQRDCMGGTHCVVSGTVGSCLIDQPLDHATSPCGGSRACADATLTCRDFTCWNGCTTSADCVPDSYCRRGVCANPTSPGSGYGVHVPCGTATTPCLPGEICATDHGSQPACRRPCTTNADCADVAATALCAAIDDPAQPAGTMACVIGCDPVRQLGCLDRDRCEASIAAGPTGMTTFLECRAPDGMSIPGAACGTTAPMLGACGVNLGCAPVMADMTGGYACRRFCVVDGDCHDAAMRCTGPTVAGIQNTNVVAGVLHMCAPM